MAPLLDEALLNDPDYIAERDSRGTLVALATAGAQVRQAMELSREAGIERVAGGERPRSVLVASLGGSAVVANVLELLAEPGSPVPVTVRRNLPLPGWVGPLDLVVAVSLSGRAPGPLAVAAEAARRGASILTVGAADSPLAEVCARARGVHIAVARGATSSRAALWSLLTPVVLALRRSSIPPRSWRLGWARRFPSSWAMARSTASRRRGQPRCCPARRASPPPTASSPTPPHRSWPALTAHSLPVVVAGPGSGSRRRDHHRQ